MDNPPARALDYARTALPHARTHAVRPQDVHTTGPEPRRPLTPDELRRLARLGFTNLAQSLAASVCDTCGGRTNGTMHRDICGPEPTHQPSSAPQPWAARPTRRAA